MEVQNKTLIAAVLWSSIWLSAGLTSMWLVLQSITGDSIRLVRIIGYFQPWLLLPLIPGVIAAVIGRRRRLALTMAGLMIIIGLPHLSFFMPRLGETPNTGPPFKIFSYSINGWHNDPAAIAAVIRKSGADIILEQGAPHRELLHNLLQNLYPDGQTYMLTLSGSSIISRFPVSPLKGISAAQKAQLDTPDGLVTVWIVHTAKEPRGYEEQIKQIKGIVADIQITEGPKIVAGDFNTTAGSVPYKLLASHLFNAHQQAGWGFGFTYPTPARRLGKLIPFIRIDHIFYSDHFYALDAETFSDSGGSDHFPVFATLALKTGGRKR